MTPRIQRLACLPSGVPDLAGVTFASAPSTQFRLLALAPAEVAEAQRLLHRYRNAAERVASFVVLAGQRPQVLVDQWATVGRGLAEAAKDLEAAVELLATLLG